MLATIVIPVGSYHLQLAHRAVQSAEAQTIPCAIITVIDARSKGTGWARNQGLAQVKTKFVIFVDADDFIERTFVEATLPYYDRGRYVYTHWYEGDRVFEAPECDAWHNGSWHTVTSLLPVAAVRHIGGFDETLPAMEDADLYLRLRRLGVCGVRCPLPLVHYTGDGQRSKQFKQSANYQHIRQRVYERYWKGT